MGNLSILVRFYSGYYPPSNRTIRTWSVSSKITINMASVSSQTKGIEIGKGSAMTFCIPYPLLTNVLCKVSRCDRVGFALRLHCNRPG